VVQHLLDSLAVVPALRRWAGDAARRILDVGSGAGLPGLVIAVSMPTLDVTCVDAVGKKASFIRQAAAELRVSNLHAVHSRVETMTEPSFALITSRAFASLSDFAALTRDRLEPGGVWLAMKGKSPSDEVDALPNEIDVFHVEQLFVPGLEVDRCLVWMRERH
jgi:16S rRNA (guanine527-N7)-methyltransferase